MTRKQIISITVGAVSSVALLVAALWNVDFRALGATLSQARLGYALYLVLGATVMLYVRAYRWRMLLPARPMPVMTYFRLTTIGLAVNNVLPLRLGEIVRALFAAEKLDLPFVTVLASIFIERLLDAVTILVLFMFASEPYKHMEWTSNMRLALTPLLGGVLLGFGALFLFETALERSRRLKALLERFPRVHKLAGELILGFRPLKKPVALVSILALGTLLWLLDGLNYFMGTKAIPGVAVPYGYAFVILASAGFSTVLPTAPGYIGAFELVVSRSLQPMGVAQEAAFGYALLVHMVAYIFTTALGIWFLYREGSSLMDVWQRATRRKEAP